MNSFLKGFSQLSESDIDMLARYEEELYRSKHTFFDPIFPTLPTISTFSYSFERCKTRNQVLWQYLNENRPIDKLKDLY